MTLKEMCEQAAVYTDRRDDFVTIKETDPVTGRVTEYYDPEDDPGIWFEAMKCSINNAYREVARALLMPDTRVETELDENGGINLMYQSPDVLQVKGVFSADGSYALEYDFVTKNEIRVRNGKKGQKVLLQYHYAPDPLERFGDEPEFPEGMVDPMVYISLACADLWMMERKTQPAQMWQQRYYSALAGIRRDMKSASKRRIRRAIFR